MNGAARKQLRQTVASVVSGVFDIGDVKSGRVYDAREGKPFVLVYLAEGTTASDELQPESESELVIGIHMPWSSYDDDDLDDWGDAIGALLPDGTDLGLPISGIMNAGFDYSEQSEEDPYIQLNLRYTVYSH